MWVDTDEEATSTLKYLDQGTYRALSPAQSTWITESGTDGIWRYQKYSDGTYTAWAKISGTITSGYCSGTLPSFTKGVPMMTASSTYGSDAMNIIITTQAMLGRVFNLYFRNGSEDNITGVYEVCMNIFGEWGD